MNRRSQTWLTQPGWGNGLCWEGAGRFLPRYCIKKVVWALHWHGGFTLQGERYRGTGKEQDQTTPLWWHKCKGTNTENKMSAILTRRKRHPRPFYQAELTNAENVLGCCINPFIPQWLCLHWNPEVLTQAKLPVDLVLKALIRKYAQWLQWELCLNNYSGYGP